ncbi:MAG: outer membrane beta-barrel protein, partial [Chthoniobacteraceae bacterium]
QPMVAYDKNPVPYVPEAFYHDHEFSISAAAALAVRSGSLGRNATFSNSTAWGANLEGKYFFTRNFGLGLEETYIDAGKPVWGTAINAYLRAPLSEGSQWAPYLFAGAGLLYGSDEGHFEGHFGAGIEYRFTQKFGMFADGRQLWVDGRNDTIPRIGLIRTGFNFVF